MRKAIALFAVLFVAVVTGACTDDTGDAPESNILETQQQALERARGVEQDVADAAKRQAEEIERAEGGR
ncbi:MAG: hypothetical protein CMP07_13580 [Xanthomonadales bacterium]|nr:hypothetical protein [Xanthomonadales bacterium]|tara:strand:- start:3154 stop:3360 length:207 start_codon:yes stop_codon:yes gene_type:complete